MAEIIAESLNAPIDMIVPRKIGLADSLKLLRPPYHALTWSVNANTGRISAAMLYCSHPTHPEFALGALTEFGDVVWNEDFLAHPDRYNLTPDSASVQQIVRDETREAARRKLAYRATLPNPQLQHKTVVVVDDGVATGATMRAAIASLRALGAARVVVAVPVGSPRTLRELGRLADCVLCPAAPSHFTAVGQFYEHFEQVEDAEVVEVMRRQEQRRQRSAMRDGAATADSRGLKAEASSAEASKERSENSSGRHV